MVPARLETTTTRRPPPRREARPPQKSLAPIKLAEARAKNMPKTLDKTIEPDYTEDEENEVVLGVSGCTKSM
jgi:hypothetical protein